MFNSDLSVKNVIVNNRTWLLLAATLFFTSSIVAYGSEMTERIIASGLLGDLESLVERVMGLPPFSAALFVFVNNFTSMLQMLVLGFAAGLSPMLTLCLNGGLLGAVLSMVAPEGVSVTQLVVISILPHGIFELSAFFLCGGLGLKFGYHCTVSPLPGRTRMESFKYIWKETLTILPLVVLLLLVAAFVEIYITSYLVGRSLPIPA